jgi:hypothetical protein
MSILNAITSGSGGVALSGDTSGNLTLQTNNGTTAVTIDTSQNVGVGTTSPQSTVGVNVAVSDTKGVVLQYNGEAKAGILLNPSGGEVRMGSINATGSYFTTLYANNAERMRIASDGGIYLGTSTSNGATGITFSNASDSASYGKSIYLNSPYNGTRNAISFAYNSSGVGAIVTGTSSTSYNSGSDYRLKDNPQPLTGSGDFIDALQPKSWIWKTDNKKGVGFIAHEVQAVSPDSVHGEKDAVDADGKPIIQTMEYGSSEFIANIILELQTLRKRVAALEAKVGA